MKTTYFFHDKPLFGIDINRNCIRVMQTSVKSGKFSVQGYGSGTFDPAAIKDGAIINPEAVAQAVKAVMEKGVQGSISSKRVALSIPSARTFSRAFTLPNLPPKELADAVQLEAEQYTPVSMDNLYLDYTLISQSPSAVEVFAVAAPKLVVDSYLQVAQLLDLEPVMVEMRVDSAVRLFSMTEFGNIPSVLINFDNESVDISIVFKNIIATGTVSLSSGSAQTPSSSQFELLIKEVRSMVRYYEERYDKAHQIEQIVLFGNAVTLTGLASLMTDQLRLPVRSADPWKTFTFAHDIPAIPANLAGDFITVAGLSVIPPKKVFHD